MESIVQTIGWVDGLSVSTGEGSDSLEVRGADLDADDNLVLKAVAAVRREIDVPPLTVVLDKRLPIAAGLGGGSSDAAAALLAARDAARSSIRLDDIAPTIGADVKLFLTGGSAHMAGFGEEIERMQPLQGFAVAVVVPAFGLDTADVYGRWDEMEGPAGDPVLDELLPPALRDGMPMRNDLLPAALALEPRLGDFMADVRAVWGNPVCMTGSGSGCFGYFAAVDEAREAADAVADLCSAALGIPLRDHGVAHVSKVTED